MQSFVESDEDNIVDALTGEEISVKNKTLDVFLQQISLMTSTDADEGENDDYVKLMTVHSSKGLEFDVVFVGGMEENLFPSAMNFAAADNIEEERRLFYVAVTRAKKHLLLTSANVRYRHGETIFGETSRFIKEIDPSYIDFDNAITGTPMGSMFEQRKPLTDSLRRKKPITSLRYNSLTNNRPAVQLKRKDEENGWTLADITKHEEGQRVNHIKFGFGTITELYTEGGVMRAKVKFDDFADPKTLILKFAKLRIKER